MANLCENCLKPLRHWEDCGRNFCSEKCEEEFVKKNEKKENKKLKELIINALCKQLTKKISIK